MSRKQNKGFTLVEVLIAMTILAIIVTPLLHAFVTAVRTNAKAGNILDATTLSQNIMEELKAGSLEEVAKQFKAEEDGSVVGGSIADMGTALPAEAPTADENGILTYMFKMKEVELGSTTCDVAIHISENENAKKDLANIYSMNQSDCGYYVQMENMDQRVASEFQTRNATYIYDATAQKDTAGFMEIMRRTIIITLEENAVDVTYEYEIPRGYTSEKDRTYSVTTRVFEDIEEKEELNAVYLYYYPLYSSRIDAEAMVINNAENLNVDVFLVKMDGTPPENGGLQNQMPTLKVNESGNTGKSYVRICTNLEEGRYILDSNKIRLTDLANSETMTSLYDVKIEVFKHQEKEASAFSELYLIETFTGSFMDNSQMAE